MKIKTIIAASACSMLLSPLSGTICLSGVAHASSTQDQNAPLSLEDKTSLSRIISLLGTLAVKYEGYETLLRESIEASLMPDGRAIYISLEGTGGWYNKAGKIMKGDFISFPYAKKFIEECRKTGANPKNMKALVDALMKAEELDGLGYLLNPNDRLKKSILSNATYHYVPTNKGVSDADILTAFAKILYERFKAYINGEDLKILENGSDGHFKIPQIGKEAAEESRGKDPNIVIDYRTVREAKVLQEKRKNEIVLINAAIVALNEILQSGNLSWNHPKRDCIMNIIIDLGHTNLLTLLYFPIKISDVYELGKWYIDTKGKTINNHLQSKL